MILDWADLHLQPEAFHFDMHDQSPHYQSLNPDQGCLQYLTHENFLWLRIGCLNLHLAPLKNSGFTTEILQVGF